MKLQSLNCPNCGGYIKNIEGKFVCESCGGVFAMDYDDADVEHEKLQTEEERDKRKLDHDRELLETQFRLEEEARIRQDKKIRSDRLKAAWIGRITAIVVIGLIITGSVILYKQIMTSEEFRKSMGITIPTVTTEEKPDYMIAKDQLTDDFIRDAIESGRNYQRTNKQDSITVYEGLSTYTWNKAGSDISECYLLTSEDGNLFIMVFKTDYICEDNGEVKTYYNALYLENITINKSGKIICDYKVSEDEGSSGYPFYAYDQDSKDQLYREIIQAKGEYDSVLVYEAGEDEAEADIEDAADEEAEDQDGQ